MYNLNDLSNARFILENQREFVAVNSKGEELRGNLYSDEDINWSYQVIGFFKRIHSKARKLSNIGISYCEAVKVAYQIVSGLIEDVVSEVVHKYRVISRRLVDSVRRSKVQYCTPSDGVLIRRYNEVRQKIVSRAGKYRHRQECRDRADRLQSFINFK